MENKSISDQKMQLALARLVTGFAHEIRNPLNAITALIEAMILEVDNPEVIEPYKNYIDAQVHRLNRLMKDLLELGKPDSKEEYRDLDLIHLCNVTAEFWNQTPTVGDCRVKFTNNTKSKELMMKGDYSRLQQVLINLFENASFHTPSGEQLALTMERSEDTLYLSLTDRGSGITPEIEPRLFEPFFTTRKAGTGLGLGIARHIVEAHNGSLSLSNNTDSPGCTAHITLAYDA